MTAGSHTLYFIGTNPNGDNDAFVDNVRVNIGNRFGGGIIVGGADNIIGGTAAGAGNVIAGNFDNGVTLSYGTGDQVLGNFIGTNQASAPGMGNSSDGIDINGGSNNVIGGAAAAARNVISGNSRDGVEISSGSNTVEGNYIGTDVTGSQCLGNGVDGVALNDASNNVIGTNGDGVDDAAERNIISGNAGNGISLAYSCTTNVVAGNYIGTDVTSTIALGNGNNGISIASGATSNIIGVYNNADERNIISGNGGNGVNIQGFSTNTQGSGTTNNIVAGNYIGTDVTGKLNLGNGRNGVNISSGAENNIIGPLGAIGNSAQTVAFDNLVNLPPTNSSGIYLSAANGGSNLLDGVLWDSRFSVTGDEYYLGE